MKPGVSPEKRKFTRENYRAGCEFRIDGAMHAGIVSDISARGLYIQSSFIPDEGTPIEMIVRQRGLDEFAIKGRVARFKRSHRAATAVVQGGFAVEVESAPEDFFQLLIELGLG